MKKRLFVIALALLFTFVFISCGNEKTYEIAVVTDVGQLNDGGFNQGTWEGTKEFAESQGKTYKYYQPANGGDATDNDRVAAMRQAVENGAKVIVTPGYLQAAAIKTVATEYPDVKFVFVDGWNLGLSNVTAISYKEQESGFFAGYAAVKDGYTKLGGTFGGDGTNAACNRFAYGYVQGINAAAAEKEINVEVKISFQYGASFQASPELKTQISGWYNSGTEIVFACGGSMLESVKAASQDHTGKKIIGVDVDQSGSADNIITSAVKGLSASVQKVLNQWNEGKWDAELADKLSNLGASDNATGLPTADSSWRFTTFTKDEYNQLFTKVANGTFVIAGTLEVDDTDVISNVKSQEAWNTIGKDLTNVTILYE